MPDAKAFATFGFNNVSDCSRSPIRQRHSDRRLAVLLHDQAHLSGQLYVALGMVLLLSSMFVRKTIGCTGPVERT